jgi:crotonobetainyl-CoA:carnitine CoA-transferase CaiB-like acyl-CoA transferase
VLIADKSLVDEGERQLKRDAVLDRVSNWSKQHEKEPLVVEAQKRHIPAAPVSTVLDLARDPQLMARGFLKEVDHRALGQIAFPMGATASRDGTVLSAAPKLGEHNAAVLAELGYAPDAVQALQEAGAL